jgi:hypothetical protein
MTHRQVCQGIAGSTMMLLSLLLLLLLIDTRHTTKGSGYHAACWLAT